MHYLVYTWNDYEPFDIKGVFNSYEEAEDFLSSFVNWEKYKPNGKRCRKYKNAQIEGWYNAEKLSEYAYEADKTKSDFRFQFCHSTQESYS